MRLNLRIVIACLLGAALIGGCDKAAKKAKKHAKPAPAPAASLPAEPREPGPFTWKMPAGWSERGSAEPMRYATLAADDGQEVAISVFPGDAGGNLRNINRWREQVGLIRIDALDESVMQEEIDGHKTLITDVAGPKGQRILGAIVADRGRMWFFKMQGPADAVGKHKDEFLALVRSLIWAQGL